MLPTPKCGNTTWRRERWLENSKLLFRINCSTDRLVLPAVVLEVKELVVDAVINIIR